MMISIIPACAFKRDYVKIFFMEEKTVARNRKAKFEFFLLEHYEAGISLVGSEIKSVRASQVSLEEAYIKVDGKEAWLVDAHIAPYELANRFNHDPRRPRKLLLHKKEILILWNEVRQKGVTIVPVRIYLKDGKAKVEIAIAKGKKLYDKRADIAKKDMQREIERRNKEY
jgi:SsrA-binding protein